MQPENSRPKIIIVGGGFAGVNTTRILLKKVGKEADITLISDQDYHDYKPCAFRIVEGYSAAETYIPLSNLIDESHLVIDAMQSADLEKKVVTCESGALYSYDYLVIATGGKANFHGVPIIGDLTFTVNSTKEAVRLSRHIRKIVRSIPEAEGLKKISLGHFIIVGGGGTGVEMASAVARNARKTAKELGVDSSLITVDLFHAGPRVLETLRPELSKAVDKRLRDLGINIFYHRRLRREHLEDVSLGDLHIKADTIIWTAGIQPKPIIPYDKGEIDDHLYVKDHPEVYIVGDAGKDNHYGLAQTALEHAKYVSTCIQDKIKGKETPIYKSKPVSYAVPVGSGWAAIQMNHSHISGVLGWLIRRFVDIRYMIMRLSLSEAWNIITGKPREDQAIRKKILGE